VRAILPLPCRSGGQAHEYFVDDRGGGKRVIGALVPEKVPRAASQLGIHQLPQLIGRSIGLFRPVEQKRDLVVFLRHRAAV